VKAQNVLMDMVPGRNAPKLLLLKGGVDARTKTRRKGALGNEPGDSRRLATEECGWYFRKECRKKNVEWKRYEYELASADTAGRDGLEFSETAMDRERSQTVIASEPNWG